MSLSVTPAVELRDRIADHFLPDAPPCLAVGVSGGSDSLALLVLLSDWRDRGGPEISAVTVDHGLRPESAAEARQVSDVCAGLAVPHETLEWSGWDGRGNLPDKARRARYGLIAGWALAHGVADVALAHTADDQAETVLMRLAREAGLDGLSAMAPRRHDAGVTWHRPALTVTREALRGVLRARGMTWADDPGNADPAYERVRARQALAELAPLGITAEGLSAVARHLRAARVELGLQSEVAARPIVAVDQGDLVIEGEGFAALSDELARRIVQAALMWISGADYVPRGRAQMRLVDTLRAGRGMTLHGCLIGVGRGQIRMSREYRAVSGLRVPPDGIWDGRWRLSGPDAPGAEIKALGPEGLAQCPGRHQTGLPAASMAASPALWRGAELLSAPLAGLNNGWSARLSRGGEDYFATLRGDWPPH